MVMHYFLHIYIYWLEIIAQTEAKGMITISAIPEHVYASQ